MAPLLISNVKTFLTELVGTCTAYLATQTVVRCIKQKDTRLSCGLPCFCFTFYNTFNLNNSSIFFKTPLLYQTSGSYIKSLPLKKFARPPCWCYGNEATCIRRSSVTTKIHTVVLHWCQILALKRQGGRKHRSRRVCENRMPVSLDTSLDNEEHTHSAPQFRNFPCSYWNSGTHTPPPPPAAAHSHEYSFNFFSHRVKSD